jgi:hypothetical protein
MSALLIEGQPATEAEPATKTPAAGGKRSGISPSKLQIGAQRSREAKQRAAVILEVLAGVRTPTQAAQALGVAPSRYYLLEDRALAALVIACELQPRGPRHDGTRRVASLERECQRWQRECARQQALVRAAQRSIGLTAPPPPAVKDKVKKRRRRPTVRALAAASRLRQEPAAAVVSTGAVAES